MKYISFITTIKICEGYENLIDRINIYILNIQKYCEKYDISYEILICEQIDDKNLLLIGDKIINNNNVTIIKLQQTYFNPFKYNLIESYGKNVCLKEANSIFTCMTSADQMFSEDFFIFIKTLQLKIFYRFATFDIPEINVKSIYENQSNIDDILKICSNQPIKRLCNPQCFDQNLTSLKLGQKSGDIMILDTESFKSINGWPENECFVHVDTTVCIIVCKLFRVIIPPPNVCTYTMEQQHRDHDKKRKSLHVYTDINTNIVYLLKKQIPESEEMSVDQYEWRKCLSYL